MIHADFSRAPYQSPYWGYMSSAVPHAMSRTGSRRAVARQDPLCVGGSLKISAVLCLYIPFTLVCSMTCPRASASWSLQAPW